MLAVHTSWGRFGYPEGLFSDAERTHGIHGGDIETSIMLAAYPDLVRRDKIADFSPRNYAMERDYNMAARGFSGRLRLDDAGPATPPARSAMRRSRRAAKGEAALDHGARAFVELLRDVERFELPR